MFPGPDEVSRVVTWSVTPRRDTLVTPARGHALFRLGDPGGDDPTKRRDFGNAMALALVPLPSRASVDETTAPTLTAITGAQRRLDATTSARELTRGVIAHVEMANRLLARASRTPYVAAAASEAAGFAAWLHADMSLAAARRSGDVATRALTRAAKTIDQDRRSEPPPWPWVFAFDHAKLAGYRALVAVRLTRPADALAAFAESLSAAQPAPKQRAVVMVDAATAACQDGTGRRDSDRVDEAFRLACEALGVGVTYSSERVIERARRFRREYSGQATGYVREFDDQLRVAVQ